MDDVVVLPPGTSINDRIIGSPPLPFATTIKNYDPDGSIYEQAKDAMLAFAEVDDPVGYTRAVRARAVLKAALSRPNTHRTVKDSGASKVKALDASISCLLYTSPSPRD